MEHLSIHERPPSGQAHPRPPPPHLQQQQQQQHQQQQQRGPQMMGPPQAPQLPPQMFTTAAQLLDLTDKKLVAILRDGRKYIGVLRSWDQFGNLVLQDTVERIFGGQQYADVSRGLFLIRGENVLLLGEIDLDRDDNIPEPYTKGDVDEVYALYRKESDAKKIKDKSKQKAMKGMGFVEGETGADVLS